MRLIIILIFKDRHRRAFASELCLEMDRNLDRAITVAQCSKHYLSVALLCSVIPRTLLTQ